MRRFYIILFIVVCFAGTSVSTLHADNFPAAPAQSGPSQGPPVSNVQQKMFYGYVPPPPIRHTWPGGYKVIFHELTNTLMEHILGRY